MRVTIAIERDGEPELLARVERIEDDPVVMSAVAAAGQINGEQVDALAGAVRELWGYEWTPTVSAEIPTYHQLMADLGSSYDGCSMRIRHVTDATKYLDGKSTARDRADQAATSVGRWRKWSDARVEASVRLQMAHPYRNDHRVLMASDAVKEYVGVIVIADLVKPTVPAWPLWSMPVGLGRIARRDAEILTAPWHALLGSCATSSGCPVCCPARRNGAA